jgi:2'-5' RNA ligase
LSATALIVVVPEAEALVGELRLRYDESARLGAPAHITVLFPFLAPDNVSSETLVALGSLFSTHRSFAFRLGSVGRFRTTSYLAPSPSEPFASLTEAVWRAYPEQPPFAGEFGSIVPHLTVAHGDAGEAAVASEVVADALARQGAIRSVCRAVVLMENSSGRWRRMHEFALASQSGR